MNLETALAEAARKARRESRRDPTKAREASRVANKAKRLKMMDVFADLLAEGHTVSGAAQAMGVGTATATTYMRDIRAGLGWQAV